MSMSVSVIGDERDARTCVPDDREHMEKETRTLTDKSPGKQEHAAELGRS